MAFSKWPRAAQAPQSIIAMSRLCKPPGGSSTMGSLIFGGDSDNNQPSYLDERKSRRFNPHEAKGPEHSDSNNNIKTPDAGAAELSYYAKPTAAQEQRDRLAIAPGAVSRETLQQTSTVAVARRGNSSGNNSSDYFANGMGDENQMRRTRRMFAAPSGSSSFRLG